MPDAECPIKLFFRSRRGANDNDLDLGIGGACCLRPWSLYIFLRGTKDLIYIFCAAPRIQSRKKGSRQRSHGAAAASLTDLVALGTANMEDHDTHRKIIREWMVRSNDKRLAAAQSAALATATAFPRRSSIAC